MLTIIRGLPGSGKSTLAKDMLRGEVTTNPKIIFEADMFFIDKDGNYVYNSSLIGDAHQWCQLSCSKYLNNGFDVIVANTFTTMAEIIPYFMLALKCGVDVRVFECTGEFVSIHGVPREVIEKMRSRWVSTKTVMEVWNTINKK